MANRISHLDGIMSLSMKDKEYPKKRKLFKEQSLRQNLGEAIVWQDIAEAGEADPQKLIL